MNACTCRWLSHFQVGIHALTTDANILGNSRDAYPFGNESVYFVNIVLLALDAVEHSFTAFRLLKSFPAYQGES